MAYFGTRPRRTAMRKLYHVYEADRDGSDYFLFLECDSATEAMRWVSQLSAQGRRVRVRKTRRA
jgi:hypothetical protein